LRTRGDRPFSGSVAPKAHDLAIMILLIIDIPPTTQSYIKRSMTLLTKKKQKREKSTDVSVDKYYVKHTTAIAFLLMLVYINRYNVKLITIKGGSIMKKVLFSLLAVGVILVGGLAPVKSASALPAETDVTGVITDAGVPVAGAMVTVKCGAWTKTDTTDAFGSYLVSFTFAQCPPGSI